MRKSIMNLLVAVGAVLAPPVVNALEIRSVSVPEVREGEPVSITAYVTWSADGRSTPLVSPAPNTYVVRTVTAKILPRQAPQSFYWIQPSGSGNTASGTPPTPPAPPPEISLTLLNAVAGSYRGKFPLLPSTFHSVEVTAKQTSYAVRNGQPTPYVIASEEKKLTKEFVVGLPEDCFNFPSGDLEGWQMTVYRTAGGIGEASGGNLTLSASGVDFGFGTAGGLQTKALKVATDQSLWPSLDQFSDHWSMAFDSPPLEARAAWQNIKGFTLRIQNYMGFPVWPVTVIPAMWIRKPIIKQDGTPGTVDRWWQQPAPPDSWALWHLPETETYTTVLMIPPELPPGATVLKVRVHIFGPVDGILTNLQSVPEYVRNTPKRFQLDAICPIR